MFVKQLASLCIPNVDVEMASLRHVEDFVVVRFGKEGRMCPLSVPAIGGSHLVLPHSHWPSAEALITRHTCRAFSLEYNIITSNYRININTTRLQHHHHPQMQ